MQILVDMISSEKIVGEAVRRVPTSIQTGSVAEGASVPPCSHKHDSPLSRVNHNQSHNGHLDLSRGRSEAMRNSVVAQLYADILSTKRSFPSSAAEMQRHRHMPLESCGKSMAHVTFGIHGIAQTGSLLLRRQDHRADLVELSRAWFTTPILQRGDRFLDCRRRSLANFSAESSRLTVPNSRTAQCLFRPVLTRESPLGVSHCEIRRSRYRASNPTRGTVLCLMVRICMLPISPTAVGWSRPRVRRVRSPRPYRFDTITEMSSYRLPSRHHEVAIDRPWETLRLPQSI